MSADELINKLSIVKEVKPRKKHRRSWIAQCPAHSDSSPSLYVDEGESGNVLIKCWAGCGAIDVIRSVSEEWSILFPEDGYRQEAKKIVQDVLYF